MATKADEITLLLNELQPTIEKINSFLMQDRVSYELILGDLNSLQAKIKAEMEKYQLIQNQIAAASKQSDQILDAAKSQAAGIIAAAHKDRMEGLALLEGVKDFCKGMDRKHWAELKEKTAVAA